MVYATDSGDDWVEIWNFTLSQKNHESLYVYFVRSVNNVLLARDLKDPIQKPGFFISAFGELSRQT